MTLRSFLPALMGAVMGLMMLRLVHGALTGQSAMAAPALIGFILLHVVVLGALAALMIWAARYAPALRHRLDRLHRPSLRHLTQMLTGALAAVLAAHLFLHGGL